MLTQFFNVIFYPTEATVQARLRSLIVLTCIFLVGFFHLRMFLNYGEITFIAEDWSIPFKRLGILKQSLTDQIIPYHISTAFYGSFETNRFLAAPSLNLSPHIWLLKHLGPGDFLLTHFLILYSLGFWGCLLIKKKYQLSIFSFSILYLIFNFNGHITSHISIGHIWSGGYFLLPFFLLWVLELIEGNQSIAIAGKLSLGLFFILLQGGLHCYIWCLMFIGLLCVTGKEYRKPILLTIIFTLSISLFKLLPAAISLHHLEHDFMLGFPSLYTVLEALIQLKDHTYTVPLENEVGVRIGWWEFDHYIGVLGLGVILYFGIYQRYKKGPNLGPHEYKALDIPLIVMSVFSLSYLYGFVAKLPIPLINVERVSSRFLIVPLIMLTIISCIRLQQTINKNKITIRTGLLALAGITHAGFSFGAHSLIWQVLRAEKAYKDNIVDLNVPSIIPNPETGWFYVLSVNFSFIFSAIALLALVYFCFFSRYSQKTL